MFLAFLWVSQKIQSKLLERNIFPTYTHTTVYTENQLSSYPFFWYFEQNFTWILQQYEQITLSGNSQPKTLFLEIIQGWPIEVTVFENSIQKAKALIHTTGATITGSVFTIKNLGWYCQYTLSSLPHDKSLFPYNYKIYVNTIGNTQYIHGIQKIKK